MIKQTKKTEVEKLVDAQVKGKKVKGAESAQPAADDRDLDVRVTKFRVEIDD